MSDIGNELVVDPTPPVPTAEQAPEPPLEPVLEPEKTFTQKDVDDIIGKRLAKESRRAERDAQNRESRIQQEIAQRIQKIQPQQPVRTGAPKPDDFQDYESYIDARMDFKSEQYMSGIHQQGEAQPRPHDR